MLKEGGKQLQLHSTFAITKEKLNRSSLKQSLNAFKVIQHRFNKFHHGFKGVVNGFDIALQQKIEWMLKPFARAFMLTGWYLHDESTEVSIKVKSTPTSLPVKGRVIKHTTVK